MHLFALLKLTRLLVATPQEVPFKYQLDKEIRIRKNFGIRDYKKDCLTLSFY